MYTIKVTPNYLHQENEIPIFDPEKLPVLANVSLTFNNSLVVEQIRIIAREMSDFSQQSFSIDMPNVLTKTGYKDICNPITKDFREELYKNIMDVFATTSKGRMKADFQMEKKSLPIEARISLLENHPYAKAIGSIIIDGCFSIHSVTIKESKAGNLYIDMPSYKTGSVDLKTEKNIYSDFCFPSTKEAYSAISRVMLHAYQTELQKKTNFQKTMENRSSLTQAPQHQEASRIFLPAPEEWINQEKHENKNWITISKENIQESTENAILFRIPHTNAENYLWLDKKELKETHNGKSYAYEMDRGREYEISYANGKKSGNMQGSDLIDNHFDIKDEEKLKKAPSSHNTFRKPGRSR